MSRRARLAAAVGLTVVVTGMLVSGNTTSEVEPQPTPQRVYTSCLVTDTKPVPADDDPCALTSR